MAETDGELLSAAFDWILNDDAGFFKQLEPATLAELLSASDFSGLSIFHAAAARNAVNCLAFLVDKEPGLVNIVDNTEQQWTPLHHCAENDCLESAEILVQYGADVFMKSSPEDGQEMPVHQAAYRGNMQIVVFLIETFPKLKWAVDGAGKQPIHMAAQGDSIDVIDYLTSVGVDINQPDEGEWRRTCLHQAASSGQIETVKWLVEKGADIFAKTSPEDLEDMPVHLAALFGHLKVVKFFIEHFPEMKVAKNGDGDYPIHKAAYGGDSAVIDYLTSLGIDVNLPSDGLFQRTCLHIAVDGGNVDLVRWLVVSKGANVFAKSSPEDSESLPVHLAASFGHLPVVQFFVEGYPDLKTAVNGQGDYPIHKAALSNQLEIVQYFFSLGMDLNTPDESESQRTCLHKAAEQGHLDLVEWLVSREANVLAKSSLNDDEDTPIHLAAAFGQLAIVQFFIENYPELKAYGNFYELGNFPIHKAAIGNQIEVLEYFLSVGLDVDIPDGGKGYTCLHHAAKKGHLDLVKWLISKGANVFAKSKDQATPLHIAAEFGQFDVVNFLAENYPAPKVKSPIQPDAEASAQEIIVTSSILEEKNMSPSFLEQVVSDLINYFFDG